jgi:hypothetical protein
MKPTDDKLAEYLADNDAPCPVCEYNLRGLTTASCPECGRELTLADVSAPRRVRPGWWCWSGIVIDFNLSCATGFFADGRTALDVMSVLRSAAVVGISAGFTGIFLILARVRRHWHDEESFAEELTWAIWVPLIFKLTCFGGVLLSVAGF